MEKESLRVYWLRSLRKLLIIEVVVFAAVTGIFFVLDQQTAYGELLVICGGLLMALGTMASLSGENMNWRGNTPFEQTFFVRDAAEHAHQTWQQRLQVYTLTLQMLLIGAIPLLIGILIQEV